MQVQSQGKGKSKSSTARLDLGSLEWNVDDINSDGCLARGEGPEQDHYYADYTLNYYGRPVYDPCVFDPDKSDGEDFDSEAKIEAAAERIVRNMERIRVDHKQKTKGKGRGKMHAGFNPGWNNVVTAMMSGLMGCSQVIQEEELGRNFDEVEIIGETVPSDVQDLGVMVCMMITAIIVILIGRWMTSRVTRRPQPIGVVDVLHKDELFRKIVEFSGFENKYWKLAAIHRDCLWHRDSLLKGLAEDRELEALLLTREADAELISHTSYLNRFHMFPLPDVSRLGETAITHTTAERDHVANDTGFRIPAEGDIRCSREHR